MKPGEARGIITTILILSGLFSLSTGAILYFLKYGMWLGLTRKFINDTHAVSGLIMGIAVIIHCLLNRRIYVKRIKNLFSGKKP